MVSLYSWWCRRIWFIVYPAFLIILINIFPTSRHLFENTVNQQLYDQDPRLVVGYTISCDGWQQVGFLFLEEWTIVPPASNPYFLPSVLPVRFFGGFRCRPIFRLCPSSLIVPQVPLFLYDPFCPSSLSPIRLFSGFPCSQITLLNLDLIRRSTNLIYCIFQYFVSTTNMPVPYCSRAIYMAPSIKHLCNTVKQSGRNISTIW